MEAKNPPDVEFTIGSEKITANKGILSMHSSIFASMFESDMIEKRTSQVEIIDIEPKIFKLFLSYLYSGKLDCKITEDLLRLAVVADKYSLESLVSLCCYRLKFIIKYKGDVVKTKSYEKMVKLHAHLLSEIFCQINSS